MVRNMRRKIATTFTVELDQLDRLSEEAQLSRTNRSVIVREGIERELERRKKERLAKVDDGQVVDAAAAAETTARST